MVRPGHENSSASFCVKCGFVAPRRKPQPRCRIGAALYPRQNGLAKALREVGRIERTLFTLDWIKNPDLRRRAHLGLNKGEARNALARAVYFCRLGEVRDRSFENQFFRASGLNLLVSAIILWNTKYLEVAYTELRRQGETINDDLLRHVAPLGWEHIGLTGDYVWSTADQTAGRYAQSAAAAAISTGGLSSLNVPDVVHSEHFRVVTPSCRHCSTMRCGAKSSAILKLRISGTRAAACRISKSTARARRGGFCRCIPRPTH